MSKSDVEREAIKIREAVRYIRVARLFHRVHRRGDGERAAHADQLRMQRDAAWAAWRRLYEKRQKLIGPTPWAFASIRVPVKIIG